MIVQVMERNALPALYCNLNFFLHVAYVHCTYQLGPPLRWGCRLVKPVVFCLIVKVTRTETRESYIFIINKKALQSNTNCPPASTCLGYVLNKSGDGSQCGRGGDQDQDQGYHVTFHIGTPPFEQAATTENVGGNQQETHPLDGF